MKFIAPSGFSQGLNNPLEIPGGGMHIPKGMIFSIGGDDVPYDRAGRGLTGKDLKTFQSLYHLLVPLDSERGGQILAECECEKKLEAEKMKEANKAVKVEISETNEKWYQKPFGIVVLSVLSLTISAIIWLVLQHFFPRLFHS